MSIINKLLNKQQDDEHEPEVTEVPEEVIKKRTPRPRIEGRIIKLGDGWGFISSKSIPYTRIFFHWSALNQNTLRFPELTRGMFVEFEPIEIPEKGYRAIRIDVLEDEETEVESDE